ncbi:MAG: polysaccharide biosynthesis protein [Cyclobacteriaceae bacterium]|jgi:FlaA1/EpsC-like NDP-sugar epimerase
MAPEKATKRLIVSLRNLRILPQWVIVCIDLGIIAFSALLGYLLRFNFSLGEMEHHQFWLGMLVYTSLGLLSILITNSHRGIIRYTGLQDSVRIIAMAGLNMVLVVLFNLVYYYNRGTYFIPYSVVFITLLGTFLFLFNYRLVVKYVFTYYKNALLKKSRVMIFGAGQNGIVTRHVIGSVPRLHVVGFLEDAPDKISKQVDGVRIYSAREADLDGILKELSIDEIIIAAKDLSLERKNELVDICVRNQVKVRTIPPVERWVRGELSLNQIREINIEELLGRELIRIQNEGVQSDLRNSRILISGAAGSIGSELVRQVIQFEPELLVLIDQAESPLYELERELKGIKTRTQIVLGIADITNKARLSGYFERYKPDLVYHAAAYKHVPMMEGNPSEAILCNILGTKNMADLAVEFRTRKFVMVSTDKAVNPTNVMGCSKRIAEIYVQSLNTSILEKGGGTAFVTTRFGNVLGSNGSVIPLFKRQIEAGGPVTVTHPEITRYFMTIPEACQLVIEAGTMGKGGEIFIFDMGKSMKILDLARKMIWLSGYQPEKDIDIVFTGLREGEKLHEELLNISENTMPTHHHKILIARVKEYPYDEINRYVELFNDLVNDKNELKMVALMKELVPEYISNYSRYEVLDKANV